MPLHFEFAQFGQGGTILSAHGRIDKVIGSADGGLDFGLRLVECLPAGAWTAKLHDDRLVPSSGAEIAKGRVLAH